MLLYKNDIIKSFTHLDYKQARLNENYDFKLRGATVARNNHSFSHVLDLRSSECSQSW